MIKFFILYSVKIKKLVISDITCNFHPVSSSSWIFGISLGFQSMTLKRDALTVIKKVKGNKEDN